jgi:hypothetical protein
MRVAVIDDDVLTRAGAKVLFDGNPSFTHSSTFTFEQALATPRERWREFDRIVVDVHDRSRERREAGTDVYTGVEIIESFRRAGATAQILAITPTKANPLLTERLVHSGVHFVYERWDFASGRDLIEAVLTPCESARPKSHHPRVLLQEGVGRRSNPNHAMDAFKTSPLYGRVRPDITQQATGSRRAATRLRDEVIATGFVGSGQDPRWNEVRDYLLKLAGRMAVAERRPPV